MSPQVLRRPHALCTHCAPWNGQLALQIIGNDEAGAGQIVQRNQLWGGSLVVAKEIAGKQARMQKRVLTVPDASFEGAICRCLHQSCWHHLVLDFCYEHPFHAKTARKVISSRAFLQEPLCGSLPLSVVFLLCIVIHEQADFALCLEHHGAAGKGPVS